MRGYPHFPFWIPLTLAKIYFFSIVITFAKIHLYKEAPSLIDYSVDMVRKGEDANEPQEANCSLPESLSPVSVA